MFCRQCGTKNESGDIFCKNCGFKLDREEDLLKNMNQAFVQPQVNEMPPVTEQPVFEEKLPEIEQPVFEEKLPEIEQPVFEEKLPEIEQPVFEEKLPEIEEPVFEEKLSEIEEPVFEEQKPKAEQQVFEQRQPQNVQPPFYVFDEKMLPSEYKPIGMWGYFGYDILFLIPVIGWILILVFAFGGAHNKNLRNYARSYFCKLIIAVVIGVLVFLVMMSKVSF